jgi:hypothetical protein
VSRFDPAYGGPVPLVESCSFVNNSLLTGYDTGRSCFNAQVRLHCPLSTAFLLRDINVTDSRSCGVCSDTCRLDISRSQFLRNGDQIDEQAIYHSGPTFSLQTSTIAESKCQALSVLNSQWAISQNIFSNNTGGRNILYLVVNNHNPQNHTLVSHSQDCGALQSVMGLVCIKWVVLCFMC